MPPSQPLIVTLRPAVRWLERSGEMLAFLIRTGSRARPRASLLHALAHQVVFIGAQSSPIIGIAGIFIGMVVALQFHDTLVRFGAVGLLGSAIGLSLVRELAPVITALMVIARAGSSTSAEIAIMRTEQQIDALECMGIDAYRFVALPRLLAFVISVPLLFAMFTVIGIAGGYAFAIYGFDLGHGRFVDTLRDTVTWSDVGLGFAKAFLFGLLIGWICVGKGFLLHRSRHAMLGNAAVSACTTEAVVGAALAVLFTDYALTAAWHGG